MTTTTTKKKGRADDEAWLEKMRARLDQEAARLEGGRDLAPLSKKYAAHKTCATVPHVRALKGGRK
jgi:hypothetical protein